MALAHSYAKLRLVWDRLIHGSKDLLAEVVPLSRSFWPKDGDPGCMEKQTVSDMS